MNSKTWLKIGKFSAALLVLTCKPELLFAQSEIAQTTETSDAAGSPSESKLRDLIRDEVGKALDKQNASKGPFELSVKGYGDMRFAYYDYAEDANVDEGSRGDSRVGFDITRFVFEIEGEHAPTGVEFEAEVEFEHGGTGSAVELEQEEFGEFESEVEKGGEVLLEELYLEKDWGDGWSTRAGRFYVAMGLLSEYYLPTDYLATGRSEAETTILPAVWDEIGFQAQKEFDEGTATVQIVNGLDSSGFSASRWVAGGHQTDFESVRAEDLAYVARVDLTVVRDLVFGGSVYYGASTDNRAKSDLDVDGDVIIGDVHARYTRAAFRAQGAVILGDLSDAGEISERNARLPNSLGVERTPVADQAMGLWAEAGYNIGTCFGIEDDHRIDPFYRFDYYDTYFDTRDSLADNDRYERFVHTFGIAYTYQQFLTAKLDYTWREFGEDALDDQNMVRLGLGFVY